MAAITFVAADGRTYTQEQVWDALTERYGPGWDDETDLRMRGEPIDDEPFAEAPTHARITRRRTRLTADSLPHAPGAHWADVPCLCDCHFSRSSCDDRDCRKGGETRARFYAREQERKQARWIKQQQHKGA